ncbi:MAG TPA: ATP-binding protein, partial [Acidimicrobiales bacterium]|nr:ATP-binding protein [Acidimicrobiales bacterium]
DVVLLASELVTNAVLHGREPVELRLSRRAGELLLEVFDAAGSLPRRRHPTAADESGRGLQMVRLLSSETGVRLAADGKWVWCTVAVDA